ncbi:unnamed protein product [Orchesella dallaii]|uniref:Uncharacterized protein n=1 Tax=Orchesella dallaii TaxID=48710 RepID=A0ABP1RPL7_9HEXA
MLNQWVYQVFFPMLLGLMAICFILGVILIVKSYILTRLRINILTTMRRRRVNGPAPRNYYVESTEIRSSHLQQIHNNDTRTFVPSTTHGRSGQRQSELTELATAS